MINETTEGQEAEETRPFSFFTTPRSANRWMTVYVVVRLQPSLSLHSFASSALGSGSCSHKIRQNRYSLSKIFGVDIGIPSLSNTLDCNCSLTHQTALVKPPLQKGSFLRTENFRQDATLAEFLRVGKRSADANAARPTISCGGCYVYLATWAEMG